jgi:hypothetical protein
MGAFGGLIQTKRGRNLQAKAQTGVQLHFTRIAIGDGSLSGQQIADLTALISQKKSLNISKLKTQTGGKAIVGCVLSNQDIIAGFYFREIGVFAEDPDLGEILYCYGNAGQGAEYIPAGGGPDIIEKAMDIITLVGNTANISATIESSLVYATISEAQSMADQAEENANEYTDIKFSQVSYPVTSVNNKNGDVILTASDVGAVTTQIFNEHQADYLKHTGYASATGSANAYVATLNPALSAYAEGVSLRLKINVANTGASTVDVNGLGAKSIKKSNGNDVASGNLKVGVIYTLAYDGTSFILQGEGGSGNLQPNQALPGFTFTNDDGEQVGIGDVNLVPENIVLGKTIFGVTGAKKAGLYNPGDVVPVSKISAAISYPNTPTAELPTAITNGTPSQNCRRQAFYVPHVYLSHELNTDYKLECWNYETQQLLWTLAFNSVTYQSRQFVFDKATGKITHVVDLPKTGSSYDIRKINPDTGVVQWTKTMTYPGNLVSENEDVFIRLNGGAGIQKLRAVDGEIVWTLTGAYNYTWAKGSYIYADGAVADTALAKAVQVRRVNKATGVVDATPTLYTISDTDYNNGFRFYLLMDIQGGIIAAGSRAGGSLDYRGNLGYFMNNTWIVSTPFNCYWNGTHMQGPNYSRYYSDDGYMTAQIIQSDGYPLITYSGTYFIDFLNGRYQYIPFSNNALIVSGTTVLGDFNDYRNWFKMFAANNNVHFVIYNTQSNAYYFIQNNILNAMANMASGQNYLGFLRKGMTFTPKTTSPYGIKFNVYAQEPGKAILS